MPRGIGHIAGEAFLPNPDQRARARLFRTAGMELVHRLGLEFPADNRRVRSAVATLPGMHEQSRWHDFEIFAFTVKFFAIGADAVTAPFAPGPHIHRGSDDVIQARPIWGVGPGR